MKKYEMNLNGNKLSIETGKIARQSDGAVMVTHGETTVLVAVNAAKEAREDIDFSHFKSNIENVIMLGEKFQVVFLRERLVHQNMKS